MKNQEWKKKTKQEWKPGNMLYPLPAVLVSTVDGQGKDNMLTIAWAGTICTNPPMVSISVRPERYSYDMLRETGEFVINLTTEKLAYATDYCGVRSGKDGDKFEILGLHRDQATHVKAPLLRESPVNIECRVRDVLELGSHHMFLADVLSVHVDERLLDEKGKLNLRKSHPIVYSHGEYFGLGDMLGTFGYSVKKRTGKKK